MNEEDWTRSKKAFVAEMREEVPEATAADLQAYENSLDQTFRASVARKRQRGKVAAPADRPRGAMVAEAPAVTKAFPPVEFDDYAADMRETASRAAEIIRKLKRDVEEREALILALLHSQGGKLRIPMFAMMEFRRGYKIQREDCLHDRTVEFSVGRANAPKTDDSQSHS